MADERLEIARADVKTSFTFDENQREMKISFVLVMVGPERNIIVEQASHVDYERSPSMLACSTGRAWETTVWLPIAIFVGCRGESSRLEIAHHTVELTAPHSFEPIGLTEPLYERGADGVIRFDECPAPERFGKLEVTIAAQRPDLGTII